MLKAGAWTTPNAFISFNLQDVTVDSLTNLLYVGGFVAAGAFNLVFFVVGRSNAKVIREAREGEIASLKLRIGNSRDSRDGRLNMTAASEDVTSPSVAVGTVVCFQRCKVVSDRTGL